MKVLVTGADGFVGSHVVHSLLTRGHRVAGGIFGSRPGPRTLSDTEIEAVQWLPFDLRDSDSVRSLVQDAMPDAVIHLAGLASVGRSWHAPAEFMEVNAVGATRLLRALRALPAPASRRPVLLVGSAEAYGAEGTEADPLTEAAPLRPLNPYGASKAAQEMAGWALGRTESIRLVQTRSFQQTGPGQRPPFVIPEWTLELLRIRDGQGPPVLSVGNIRIVRDFMDVRDAADTYVSLLETGDAEGAYNVCSGHGYSLEELAGVIQEVTGTEVDVRVDPEKMRPAEILSLIGDRSRLDAVIDERPGHAIHETIGDLAAELARSENPAGTASA